MSASNVNPKDVFLFDLYTDAYDTYKDTTRYGNNKAPTGVFPSVNYHGSASEADVKAFIQEKVVIYQLKPDGSGGEPVPYYMEKVYDSFYLSDVERSVDYPPTELTSGEDACPTAVSSSDSGQDVKRSPTTVVVSSPGINTMTDVRAGQFYWVTERIYGPLRWYAKIEETGQDTSNKLVTVTCIKLGVTHNDFEILDYQKYGNYITLRQLRYKPGSLNSNHRLLRSMNTITQAGINLGTNISYVTHAFMLRPMRWVAWIDPRFLSVPIIGSDSDWVPYVPPSGYNHWGFDLPQKLLATSQSIGWTELRGMPDSVKRGVCSKGVALVFTRKDGMMVTVHGDRDVSFATQWFQIEDNFGNHIRIYIDWSDDEKWKVTRVEVMN